MIWYLLPCKEQEEQTILNSCKRNLSNAAARDVFVLTYDQMRRFQGAWHVEKKLLFPANVLLESENEDILRGEMARQGNGGILRLEPEEENFLRFLCGKDKHIKMSRGVIVKGVTRVIEGPLRGMEAQIRKIDRHKRLASVEAPAGQRMIPAGLEIVEKSV